MKIKTKVWNKLVRDRVPEIIKDLGGEVEVKYVEGKAEKMRLLKEKLVEEAQEVKKCLKDGLLEELGDVMTVVEAIAQEDGFSVYELQEMKDKKDKLKGKFEKGIILKRTKGD